MVTSPLAAKGITVVETSTPKQTDTALTRLRRLGVPAVRTAEAAVALGLSKSAATMTLTRLAGLVTKVRHGLWWIDGPIDPYRLPDLLTAPYDSYLSLHTALHLRGLIEQIPEVFYVATQGRTQRATTEVGTFSLRHLAPEVFGGFEETTAGLRLATAEKALAALHDASGARAPARLQGERSAPLAAQDPIGAQSHAHRRAPHLVHRAIPHSSAISCRH